MRIGTDRMWNSAEFFHAKLEEQNARHARYHDTAYNLEPNVKGSPGGLRDIQMIGWLAQRHLGTRTLAELVPHKFLTPGQLADPAQGRAFLWRIRFGLHLLTGRREDRLLFDHQVKLAQMLGYEDASFTLAVEQLMQRYYRTVMELSRLNEMLLQLFEEAILLDKNEPPVPLGPRFQSRNGYLEVTDDQVFDARPVGTARDLPAARAEPRPARRQRAHDRARQAAPVAHRRGVPAEPAPSSAVPRRSCGHRRA